MTKQGSTCILSVSRYVCSVIKEICISPTQKEIDSGVDQTLNTVILHPTVAKLHPPKIT